MTRFPFVTVCPQILAAQLRERSALRAAIFGREHADARPELHAQALALEDKHAQAVNAVLCAFCEVAGVSVRQMLTGAADALEQAS